MFAPTGSDVALLADTLCTTSAAFAVAQSRLAVGAKVALAPAASDGAEQDTRAGRAGAGVSHLHPPAGAR